jgi:histone deacetylase 1/2
LVAKGFKQRYGLDYEDTFSPVIKPTNVCFCWLLLVDGLLVSWIFRMLFFMVFWRKKFICASLLVLLIRLVPSICVALRRCYMGLNKLCVLGMLASDRFFALIDLCRLQRIRLFFLLQRPQLTMYLLVYVDDIIVISSSESATARVVTTLGAHFAVKILVNSITF